MKTRILLAAGAALSAAALALTVPAMAGATASPAPATAATHMVTSSSLGGVVRPAGSAAAARSATAPASTGAPAASCAEPACNLGYHGGPVQHSPHVYLVFWGPKWTSAAADKAAASYLQKLFKGLGKSPDAWSVTTMQYPDRKGHPTFGKPVFAGAHADTHTPPKTVSINDLGNEANKAFKYFGIKDPDNAQVIVAPQSGTCYKTTSLGQFEGNCGKAAPPSSATLNYCAYHTYNYDTANAKLFLPWIALPFQADAKSDCGMNFVNNPGTFDGFSIVAGHESAETTTDPEESAWYDAHDGISGGEIADKCSWGGAAWGGHDPSGNLKLATGSFAMQSLWSNAAGRCVMTGKLHLTVAVPKPQTSLLGSKVSLSIKTSQNGHAPLTFKASGLPRGLSIGKHSGKITGKLTGKAATYHPTITVSYYGGSVSVKFKWTIRS